MEDSWGWRQNGRERGRGRGRESKSETVKAMRERNGGRETEIIRGRR